MKAEAFDKAARQWSIREELGELPRTPDELIRLFVAKNSITIDFNGLLHRPSRSKVQETYATDDLGRDLRQMNSRMQLGFQAEPMKDALAQWIAEQQNGRLRACYRAVSEPADADDEWAAFAEAIVDERHSSRRYFIALHKAFIWQVKRKLTGRNVFDHVMPVGQGPQGGGKSEAMKLFLSPLAGLVAYADFETLVDKANLGLWRTPIIFLDEMERADRADIEGIKNAITKSLHQSREFHAQRNISVLNRATLIGCMNGTLGEKIFDPTGMRRFGPWFARYKPTAANVHADLPVSDWGAINGVDFVALWRSVDPADEHPLRADLEAHDEWLRLQEDARALDSAEAWLREFLPCAARPVSKPFTLGNVYPDHSGFCQTINAKPMGPAHLGRKLGQYTDQSWCWIAVEGTTAGKTRYKFKPGADDEARNGKGVKWGKLLS